MTKEQIAALAEYLTGPMVAHHSICLQLPSGPHKEAARQFFALRDALGVRGYVKKAEVEKQFG